MYSRYPNHSDVKTYLNIQTTRDDLVLAEFVQRAIVIFENLARRTFLPKVDTKYFDGNSTEVVSWNTLFIRSEDLLTVTELMINGEVVPSDEFILSGDGPPYYKIQLLPESDFSFYNYTLNPFRSIKITGTWGYGDEIPADVFGAIVRLTAYLYAQKDNAMELDRTNAIAGGMGMPSGIPKDIERIAVVYRRIM